MTMICHKIISLLVLFLGLVQAHMAQPQPSDHVGRTARRDNDKSVFMRAQIERVHSETAALRDALSRWDGTASDAAHIQAANAQLVTVVHDAASQIATSAQSPKLNIRSALRLKDPIRALVQLTDEVVEHFIAQKQRFEDVQLRSQVKAGLEATKEASLAMNKAVVGKMPRVGRKKAGKVGEAMKRIFDKGIKAF
ncbi:hypothetical protein BD289DRAFT_487532 [Coniella lustricola]|uniref:Hydrophobic surface binding protein A-domain-containing protein n=1 Tax=Coniella lustricola TaxID=2025994 RepID=A0A2T2ZRP7_9PEZI|nr:hypothetical protein BD289DRAFT_487532 [Coniella lustricola]